MLDEDSNKQWHQYFYYVLQELLTPVGLTVQTELPVGTYPPKIDVIIIRRKTKHWTHEQLERLPDGVRHSTAPYILLEFKYTESFNENAIYQIAYYERSYRKTQKLSKKQVQSFLVISKTPRISRLARFDYNTTKHKGVYKSTNVLAMRFPMLVLNKLGNKPYNVYFKLFASKLATKREAAKVLKKEVKVQTFSQSLLWFLDALLTLWLILKGDDMIFELTPEQMVEAGKVFKEFILPRLPVEERLAGVPLEERLAGVPLKERLADILLEKISESELEKIPFVHHIEEKGIEKGEQKATIEALNQIVTLRFKGELGEFEKQLTLLPLTTLKRLTEVALTVENLAEFEQTFTEILTEINPQEHIN